MIEEKGMEIDLQRIFAFQSWIKEKESAKKLGEEERVWRKSSVPKPQVKLVKPALNHRTNYPVSPTESHGNRLHGKGVGITLAEWKVTVVKELHGEVNVHISISEGNCPERIIVLARSINAIYKAFTVVIKTLEEDISHSATSGTTDPQAACGATGYCCIGIPMNLLFTKYLSFITSVALFFGKSRYKMKKTGESTKLMTRWQDKLEETQAGHHHYITIYHWLCGPDLHGHVGNSLWSQQKRASPSDISDEEISFEVYRGINGMQSKREKAVLFQELKEQRQNGTGEPSASWGHGQGSSGVAGMWRLLEMQA
ncbi:hypothetical protein P7K49_031809 [Saguinus oedipus]|uniref:Uncharacterized protein n=1 Tax=Saguinus oedipus TaxID=9490 RepID=A0ABQ9U0I0_SAGOE|nr:hypothetical protein P7K49_031809 [Saguinus oedipus]